jgi:copper chaperone
MRGIISLMSESAVYSVPALHCAHCERAVREEVAGVRGVTSVDVDLELKVVRVAGDPLDDTAVREAIEAAGYEVA